jgi:hypothetical protein
LIQPLFSGPLDIIGDVHGEINALNDLLGHLGHSFDGSHPEGRRLVFVGDLTDRGPDSPAVVHLVTSLIEKGAAQCVMGNHELNILLGKERHGNGWFYGKAEVLDRSGRVVPQALADDGAREKTLRLFRSLPLALEREDLRIVHACWSADAVARVREAGDVVALHRDTEAAIRADLNLRGVTDSSERGLAMQNGNPIKVLTSGPECRTDRPYYAGGKMRNEARVPWWRDDRETVPCVCGHYWRVLLEGEDDDGLFDRSRPYEWLGNGRVMCIDYSVGKRWRERLDGRTAGSFATSLVALRWPERTLLTDRGEQINFPATIPSC